MIRFDELARAAWLIATANPSARPGRYWPASLIGGLMTS
jgi:hypothetical protein